MNKGYPEKDSLRTYQLMNELEGNEGISQRELAGRLGIAVGLVNSYLKNLAAKGFLRVKNYPRNRYAYLLTPKGIAEKSRIAYQHLHYFNNLYTTVRRDYVTLFGRFKKDGIDRVVFCGVDEVAEIAFLSLQDVGLQLDAVVDDSLIGEMFFSFKISSLSELEVDNNIPVVLTSMKRAVDLQREVIQAGYALEKVFSPREMEFNG